MARLRKTPEWTFLSVLWRAERGLAIGWWALVIIRSLLPALLAIATGVLVASVQNARPVTAPLAAVAITFVLISALAPFHDAAGQNLGARVSNWLHDRLLASCNDPPGISHLERSDLADDLAVAREFDLGISAPPTDTCLPRAGHRFVAILGAVVAGSLLFAYRWWAPLLIGGSWFATQVILRRTAVWKDWDAPEVTTERRHADYAYKLAVDAPAAKEVRLFGLADWIVERFETRRRKLTDLMFHARRMKWRSLALAISIATIAHALFFWALANSVINEDIELGRLAVFASAALAMAAMAFDGDDWWFFQGAQPIPGVLSIAERMRTAGMEVSGTRSAIGTPADAIELKDVDFRYTDESPLVFEGLNLTIAAGSSLAIVGRNGAGKTTLAKLLCRLYDPTGGAIHIDGVDLRDFDIDAWRGRLAAVFQDFVRYQYTLKDNVAPTGASDEDVTRALEMAKAGDLADLATILSRSYEGGTDLSGGQWQRVALARALHAVIAGAGVVLLDEPTAQLDVRGELEIFDALLDATRGRTTILISHRFSTVRRADRICVLEHGRVIEIGSHDDLMEQRGRYREMYELQAARFAEGIDEDDDLVDDDLVDDDRNEAGGALGATEPISAR